MRSEVGLDRTQLLEWEGWTKRSRTFLEAQDELVELRPLILRHGELIGTLNGWLLNELANENEPGLKEANKLVVERDRILIGSDDDELATWMTELWTELRSSSAPKSTDAMIERMRSAMGRPQDVDSSGQDG